MVDGFRMIRQIVDAPPMDAYRGEEYLAGHRRSAATPTS